MKNKIIIKPLNDDEIVSVLELPKFGNLKPVRCLRCDHKGEFARRIFLILGVPTTKQCDDSTQNVITSYPYNDTWPSTSNEASFRFR